MQTISPQYMPPIRFSAIPLGVLVTLAIFTLMAKLIGNDIEEPDFVEAPPIDYPIYKERIIENNLRENMVEKPIIESPPELPPSSGKEEFDSEIKYTTFHPVKSVGERAVLIFEGMPLAQVQPQPKYPARAIAKSIEGYVDVKFDITKIGTTKNISVVRAQPEGIFDRAAVNAVKRWRYRPKMEEGKAVAFPGMVQRISFKMEN